MIHVQNAVVVLLALGLCAARGSAQHRSSVTFVNTTKACKASDPALNLTKYIYRPSNTVVYYVSDNAQLKRVCECTSMDYVALGIEEPGCPTCAQESLDTCRLGSITGKDPKYGISLNIGILPPITSVQGLAGLTGALPGAFSVGTSSLTTLDGLDNIKSIGKSNSGLSIVLVNNPNLTSTTALSNAMGSLTSNTLYYALDDGVPNPLACVPKKWPVKDYNGHTIRNGKALHDPCLYSCNSDTGKCQQDTHGLQNESTCDTACAPKQTYQCSNHQCVPSASGVSKSDCEAVCQ
jgi:hypothetical protein